MKPLTPVKLIFIFLIFFTSCSPNLNQEISGEKHIIAHPQNNYNDQIAGYGWKVGTTITLEIDDPANGIGTDYSDSQEAHITEAENISVTFFPGVDWDLAPGHIITLSDGITTVTHVVQDLSIETIDIENDQIQGTAKPVSEVMVWLESPYSHELRVKADASGHWQANFTGIGDIIEASTGAVAQNDIPPSGSSHTRINWTFGHLHIEASLNEHIIGFYNFQPFGDLTFLVYHPETEELIYTGLLETDEIGSAMFENHEKLFFLEPGSLIVVRDNMTNKETSLKMRFLSLDTFDTVNNTVEGQSNPGEIVTVYIYDPATEEEYIIDTQTDAAGNWRVTFEEDISNTMELVARIFDEEHDEIAVRWVEE